jgi:C4-type Zn-finger protein
MRSAVSTSERLEVRCPVCNELAYAESYISTLPGFDPRVRLVVRCSNTKGRQGKPCGSSVP